jgi:hypothetical protein
MAEFQKARRDDGPFDLVDKLWRLRQGMSGASTHSPAYAGNNQLFGFD